MDSTPAINVTPACDVEPLLIGDHQVCRLIGLSRSEWTKLVSAGAAPEPVTLGRKRLWNLAELRAWAAAGCPPVTGGDANG